jgi:hypothetical protein
MNTILSAMIFASGWSSAPVSAPYGFVDLGQAVVTSGNSTVEIHQLAPYAPYSLICQHSEQTVAVPSADGGTRQIKINRC